MSTMTCVERVKTMRKLCAKCNICDFMPEQYIDKELFWWWGMRDEENQDNAEAPVLFIDDCSDKRDIIHALNVARDLVKGEDFIYTTTIRCDYMPGDLILPNFIKAAQRCAVWTHQLLDNRLLIVSTIMGLTQIQAGEDKKVGDIWRNTRLGVILCTPSLLAIPPAAIESYQSKIERVLKKKEVPV